MKRLNQFFKKLIVLTMLLGSVGTIELTQPNTPVEAAQAQHKKTAKKAKKAKRSKKSKKVKTKTKAKKKPAKKIKIDSSKKSKSIKQAAVKTNKDQTPTANVFIYLNQDSPNYRLVQNAMQAWNDTKAFRFKQVNNINRANIVVTSGNYGNTSWAGLTSMANVPRGWLYGSTVYLNDYYINQVNPNIALAVAEHELGHAIGLNHNDTQPSVMNSAISDQNAYTIQQCDIDAVKQIYNEK